MLTPENIVILCACACSASKLLIFVISRHKRISQKDKVVNSFARSARYLLHHYYLLPITFKKSVHAEQVKRENATLQITPKACIKSRR